MKFSISNIIIPFMRYIIYSIVGSIIIGYGLGCINLSYIISKFKGFDIRKYGSGNAGASNVIIVMGKKTGLYVAIFDIFKAYLAVTLARVIFTDAVVSGFNYAAVMAGASSIVGHIAPFYMGFKGGKGLASLGGTILGLDAKMTLLLLVVAIIIAVATDYICFVPVTMVVIIPALYGYKFGSIIPLIMFIPIILLMWYRHIENFKRIKAGKELRFHFLWDRSSESERFGIADDGKSVFENEVDDKYHMNTGIKS